MLWPGQDFGGRVSVLTLLASDSMEMLGCNWQPSNMGEERSGCPDGGRARGGTSSSALIALITSLQDLDFEAKTSYTLRIEAANKDADPRFLSLGPFSDTTTVKIIVEDVDEPPVFSSPFYPMEVSEATQVGNIIGTVAAHDPDSSNSPVR